MTLIVGIRCTDGAIVAADSAVTLAASNMPTISDKHCKIEIVRDKMILAGTGQVGMGQRFAAQLDHLWTQNGLKGGNPVEMSRRMCIAARKDFGETGAQPGKYGALVAFPASGKAELSEFAIADFQPELKTDKLWYASMGSGQLLADPYLRLMRHVFWHEGPPNLENGKFAAMWVLHHAIKAAPGGIAEPIDMAVLEYKGKEPHARMLDEKELEEHQGAVEEATQHFREFENLMKGKSGEPPPSLPKMEG